MPVSPRLAPLSGLAGIALLGGGWFWDPAPSLDFSDGRLADWFASGGAHAWLAAAVLQLLAVPFLWLFAGAVRDRLAAGGASVRTRKVAEGAGKAFAGSVLCFGAIYAASPLTMVLGGTPAPTGDIVRFVGSADFALFVVFGALSAVALTVAISVAAFSTRAVPLWLGIVGIPLAVIMLANPFLPMAGITLWFVVASVTLAVRPVAPAVRVPAPREAPSLPLGVPTM
jgi:hypothetical protein